MTDHSDCKWRGLLMGALKKGEVTVAVHRCFSKHSENSVCVETPEEVEIIPNKFVNVCQFCNAYDKLANPPQQQLFNVDAVRLGMPISLKVREPVGTELENLFKELGFEKDCDTCRSMTVMMDQFGIQGVEANRAMILDQLRKSSKSITVWEMFKTGIKGYFTVDQILDEAIKRAKETYERNQVGIRGNNSSGTTEDQPTENTSEP